MHACTLLPLPRPHRNKTAAEPTTRSQTSPPSRYRTKSVRTLLPIRTAFRSNSKPVEYFLPYCPKDADINSEIPAGNTDHMAHPPPCPKSSHTDTVRALSETQGYKHF